MPWNSLDRSIRRKAVAEPLKVHGQFIVRNQETLRAVDRQNEVQKKLPNWLTLSFTSSWIVRLTFHSFAVSSTSDMDVEGNAIS